METRRISLRILAGIFVLALLARLALGFAFLRPAQPVAEDPLAGDALAYLSIAKNWLERGEFATAPGELTSHRMPLYPGFLAATRWAFGDSALAPKLLQVLMGSGTAVFTALLAALLFGRAAGIFAGLGIALDPFLIYYDYRLWSESPFILLMAWVAYHYARLERGSSLRQEVLGGVLIGTATLVRPDAGILVPFLAPWAWVRLGGWRPAARLVAVALAIQMAMLAPWQYRNWKLQGSFVPFTTEAGHILWQTNNLETLTRPDLHGFWYPWPGHPNASYLLGPDVSRDDRFADINIKNEAELDHRYKGLVYQFWRENLGAMPRYVLYKWMRFFQVSPAFDVWSSAQGVIYGLWYVPLLALFVAGIVLDLAGQRRGLLLYVLLALFFFKATLFHINTRYRLQVEPIIMAFAALAVAQAASAASRSGFWRSRIERRLGTGAAPTGNPA